MEGANIYAIPLEEQLRILNRAHRWRTQTAHDVMAFSVIYSCVMLFLRVLGCDVSQTDLISGAVVGVFVCLIIACYEEQMINWYRLHFNQDQTGPEPRVPEQATRYFQDSEAPSLAAGSEAPGRAAGSEAPGRAAGSEAPGLAAGSEAPGLAAGSEAPTLAGGAEVPSVAADVQNQTGSTAQTSVQPKIRHLSTDRDVSDMCQFVKEIRNITVELKNSNHCLTETNSEMEALKLSFISATEKLEAFKAALNQLKQSVLSSDAMAANFSKVSRPNDIHTAVATGSIKNSQMVQSGIRGKFINPRSPPSALSLECSTAPWADDPREEIPRRKINYKDLYSQLSPRPHSQVAANRGTSHHIFPEMPSSESSESLISMATEISRISCSQGSNERQELTNPPVVQAQPHQAVRFWGRFRRAFQNWSRIKNRRPRVNLHRDYTTLIGK